MVKLILEAAIREGADELTLRANQERVLRTVIDTTNVGNKRRGPPLVTRSGMSSARPFFQGPGP